MLAGGLGGLYITAKSADANYSEAGAKLLNDQNLITYCKNYLAALTPELKNQSEVKAIVAALTLMQ